MSDDAANRQALRLAVRPDGSAFAAWARAHAGAVDWPWVLGAAEAHKLAALLAARLAGAGIDTSLDARLRRRLFMARVEAARRAGMAERTLATVAAALDAGDLPFFVVKGSVLARQVYGDPHLRRFADVDVVVRHADVPRAEALLAQLGYRAGGAEGLLATRLTGDAEHARAQVLTRDFDRRHLAAHTWYAPAAMLIHLAAHATTCLLNGFRLLHLVDVAWAATRFADQAAATWQLAAEWRVAPHLAQVLAMAERLLEIELPLDAGPGAPRPARPWSEAATTEAFLLDAAHLARRSPASRLWREAVWSVAMGCVRRNVTVVCAASLARARFRTFRRQQRSSRAV